ncbi:MAG: double-strand break repair protein AddB, partial [Alphaproteobacteria bacterium]|nr:double-strand break repair protein AddB [Alphaproteobacteria bacterium]
ALRPFADAIASAAAPPGELLACHVALVERLANDETGAPVALWSGDAGEGLRECLLDLAEALSPMAPIPGRQWPSMLEALLDDAVVRPRVPAHPRLAIWGPLEARLQSADVVVLGGLNEGSWPPEIGDDPWLSRPMRAALGLPPAERRIGLSAHDFVQAAAQGVIVLSFSRKVDGVPATPSRWLQRLGALLAKDPGWANCLDTQRLAWAAALDAPASLLRLGKPAPRPPVAARPSRLPVTSIETLVRDPYAVYARRVLRLEPLEPLDLPPGAAERGTMIHAALGAFLAALGETWPDDALDRLFAEGRKVYGDLLDRPVVRALWWPRFERLARWFVDWERRRRADGTLPVGLEVKGALDIAVAGGFRLEARADRIDRDAAGRLAILDYKTGAVPSSTEIEVGFAPQLPLEGAIAAAGGFAGVATAKLGALVHVRLTGGDPAGAMEVVLPKRDKQVLDAETLAAEARAGLERLIARYADPATPYLARPRVQFIHERGRYDHLARIAEWSAGGEEG